mmetsp:Transcript_28477/g.55775  ORF Transcript_28477/g.55775 Transcript_28477/m.55775 type:complete len:221 (+) Transcript_28477:292-954(+)
MAAKLVLSLEKSQGKRIGSIGKVDCAVHRDPCSIFKVTRYPTIRYFPDGLKSPHIEYDGPRQAHSLAAFLQRMHTPPVTVLSSERELANKHRLQSVDPPTDHVVEALFDLFDKDDSGTIDALKDVFGFSTLCEGDKEQKKQAVFEALDTNSNKVISKEELFKVVFAVFQDVVTEKKLRKLRALGVEVYTARELAEHTVAEAFKQADTNSDSVFSNEEFKK